MRVLVALGGNALLRRGEKPDAGVQLHHVRDAANAIATLANSHDVIVTHGNGPQVGMLAVESASDPALSRPYPLDVLGAQTQGMIGYLLAQALHNALPGRQVATLVTQTIVSAHDPAFTDPTKFVGSVYTEAEASRLATANRWSVRADGMGWRRVVPSPTPRSVVETSLIRTLADQRVVVVCAGGGGIPVIRCGRTGELRGVEAVVDKDLTAAILAESLDADMLILLTDVAAVIRGYGGPHPEPISRTTPNELRAERFARGSMGPKVEAACRFVEQTGHPAAIGAMDQAEAILAGTAGTSVTARPPQGAEQSVAATRG